MKVNLTYFTCSGKYYSNGEYETHKERWFEIVNEVRKLIDTKSYPGLINHQLDFTVLIDVPEHPYNHPTLVHPVSWLQVLLEMREKNG